MNQRTLVVGDPALLSLARGWASAGLIGPSYWALEEDCSPEGLASAGVPCVHLPDGVALQQDLVTTLAADDPAAGVRVIWARRNPVGAEAERAHEAMEALDALLRPRAASVDRIDLVAPQRDGLPNWPDSPARWETIVLGDEDAATPAGTTTAAADGTPQLLHAACVLGGVLGGRAHSRPYLSEAGAQPTRAATIFSRVVAGREALTVAMADFESAVLPAASALELHPRLHTDEGRQVLLRDAEALVRRATPDGILLNQPPSQDFERRQLIDTGGFFSQLKDFVEYLFLRSTPLSTRQALENQIADVIEHTDMGFEVTRHEPGEVDIVNFFEADAALVAHLHERWRNKVERSEGAKPDPSVWQDLLQLSTGMVDGGTLPRDLPPATRGDRRIVVPLESIQGGGSTDDAFIRDTAAIAHEPLTAETGAVTTGLVESLITGASPALIGTGTVGSRVTTHLADVVDGLDHGIRDQQLELLVRERSTAPLSWIEKLRANVAADLVAAKLDADRSQQLATADLDCITPLRAARFWFWTVGGVGGAGALQAANFVWGADLSAWLLVNTGLSVPTLTLTFLASVVSVLMVVLPFLSYFRHYLTYRERGLRQLEARLMLHRRATHCYQEHLRLTTADRILARWTTILRGLYPSTPHGEPARRTKELSAPLSLRVATLVPPEKEMARWMAETAAPPGWRGRALSGVAGVASPDVASDTLSRLCEDDGRPAGPLDALATEIDQCWRAWHEPHARRVTAALHHKALNETRHVASDGSSILLADFISAIDGEMTAGQSYGRPPAANPGQPQEFQVGLATDTINPDVFLAVSQIFHRRLDPDEPLEDVDTEPPTPGPDA